jgi:hypothetical protein
MLIRLDPPSGPAAHVEYKDGSLRILRQGTHVICAVTRTAISLETLRYWSVEYQEAYASPEAVFTRLGLTLRTDTI